MAFTFKKATKRESFLRMALIGISGSGKTYSALNIGQHLGKKVALIDTEHGSASKYSDYFDFDVLELDFFSVENYLAAIRAAEDAGYDVLVIDSLSHAWAGQGGLLEFVDNVKARGGSYGNSNHFAAWREATPKHNELVETMLASRLHLIVTMRAKTAYEMQEDEKGRKVPVKIGLQPVQRDGLEYEMDVVADMDAQNRLIVSKTRCRELAGGVFPNPGEGVAGILKEWLGAGEPLATDEQVLALVALYRNLRPESDKSDSDVIRTLCQWATGDSAATEANVAAAMTKLRESAKGAGE